MSESDQQGDAAVVADNDLICEKLLGWKRGQVIGWESETKWHDQPTFTTWAEAGLVIDALGTRHIAVEISVAKFPDGDERAGVHLLPYIPVPGKDLIQLHWLQMSGPAAIRAAALKWLKEYCW